MTFTTLVITDDSCERASTKLIELIEKLRQVKSARLYILIRGQGVSTVIPRVREALLSNLSTGIRLYIFSNADELQKLVDDCVKELGRVDHAYVIIDDDSLRDSTLRILNRYGINDVSIC